MKLKTLLEFKNKLLYDLQWTGLENKFPRNDGYIGFFLEAVGDLFREYNGNSDTFYMNSKIKRLKSFKKTNQSDINVIKRHRDEKYITGLKKYKRNVEYVRSHVKIKNKKLFLYLDIMRAIANVGIYTKTENDDALFVAKKLINKLQYF